MSPQYLTLMLCAGTLFTERGTIVTVFIIFYALTSFVAGYVRCGITARQLACPVSKWLPSQRVIMQGSAEQTRLGALRVQILHLMACCIRSRPVLIVLWTCSAPARLRAVVWRSVY